eukprot:3141341-Karenia_brevis.AAC.1
MEATMGIKREGPGNVCRDGNLQDVGDVGVNPDIQCFKCGQTGHPAFKCPTKGHGADKGEFKGKGKGYGKSCAP